MTEIELSPEILLRYKELLAHDVQYLPGGYNELAKFLYDAELNDKKLIIKLGIDPTSTDLHLGHTVCLHFLRKFKELGHIPVLIIGGFTATVGDPSGRNEARPPLTYEQVKENSRTYLDQVRKILPDIKELDDLNLLNSPNSPYSPFDFPVAINNYLWFRDFNLKELINLACTVTVNQLIGKEAFGNRIDKGEPLYLHEVLYPILQGYDSVAIKADIELGGIDQTYNVLFGRHIQKYFRNKRTYKKNEQLAIFLPLLIGLDGSKKMSKSFGNQIALNDPPSEVFGKTMSLPDELIIHYFKLVSDLKAEEVFNYEQEIKQGINPRDIKMVLAHTLVRQLHSVEEADSAKENFIKQFQKNELPDDMEEFSLKEPMKITDLMLVAKLIPSKGEGKRLIDGGGVKLGSVKVEDPNLLITSDHKNTVLQIGKRKFVKII